MWLAQMGLYLYRIFDRTEGCERSYRPAERGTRLTARGVTPPVSGCCVPSSTKCTNCSRTSGRG